MSFSSLIFNMRVISMKVNPAFFSILIITTLLAIHTPVYSYLAITSALGRSELGLYHSPHTFCKRCLCLSSWDGLILDSYHGPHTFVWGVSVHRHAAIWIWAHIMAFTPSVRGVSACHGAVSSSFIGDDSSGSKILYHYVDYGRDYCHWSHRKRELWYIHRNLSSHFLCLELLCLRLS